MTRRQWPKETHDHLEAKIQKIREAVMDEAERLAEQEARDACRVEPKHIDAALDAIVWPKGLWK